MRSYGHSAVGLGAHYVCANTLAALECTAIEN